MTAAPALQAHKDPQITAVGEAALTDLQKLSAALVHAAIVTEDGFEVCRRPRAIGAGDRLASMASSIQALSDAVALDLTIGAAQSVIIQADTGHVIQLRIPGNDLVLVALFDRSAALADVIGVSQITASWISAGLAGLASEAAA